MFTISGRVFGFLSTLSLRRATATLGAKKYCYRISIHALLAESDLCHHISKNAAIGFLSTLSLRRATVHSVNTQVSTVDFYPRSPCGERLYVLAFALRLHPFLSTLSLRRATETHVVMEAIKVISIHALLAESDPTPAKKSVC